MPRIDGYVLAETATFIEIAMLIFIAIFVGIVLWVVFTRPGRFNDAARIPLEENRVVTPRETDRTAPSRAADDQGAAT
jgi:hypothetical protein